MSSMTGQHLVLHVISRLCDLFTQIVAIDIVGCKPLKNKNYQTLFDDIR